MKLPSSEVAAPTEDFECQVTVPITPDEAEGPAGPSRVADEPSLASGVRLFIIHAPEDDFFVKGFLLGALQLPDHEVLLSSTLDPGAVQVEELERGARSPLTLVVMSPELLLSPWAQLAHQLAAHHNVEAANDERATLIPAILRDCALPLLSRARVSLDFRNQARGHWEAESARLRAKLRARASTAVAPPACPYPGIRPFTAQEAAHFHGREEEIRELLGRLRDGQRELYVIGPSGSGKSSLVAAGLLPRLRQVPALAGGTFLIRTMCPGAEPRAALAEILEASSAERDEATIPWASDAVGELLARHPGCQRLLIFVDQLEELFTTARKPAREAFIAALRELRATSHTVLVLAMRADFYASLMESTLWSDLQGRLSRLDVSPLRGAKLRLAIEAPAQALDVYFEPVLVERLLHDVADEPGALPLLQDILLELWHHRTQNLLRLADYEAKHDGGQTGLAATLARRANGALRELSAEQQGIARFLLLRLIQFGEGMAMTRRQQTRAALATAGDDPEDIDAVIRHLADRRLITTTGGDDRNPAARVDLAHEILLSTWPTLGEWIESFREDEGHRRVLEGKASEWVKRGRGQARLLDADELREIRDWLTDGKVRDLGVSEEILSLLAASAAALAEQAAAAERQTRIAAEQAREMRMQVRETRKQLARNLLSQGHLLLTSGRPAQALPYLIAAREAGMEDVSLRSLFRWAARGIPLLRIRHRDMVHGVAWSPDGSRLATASASGTAHIWNAVTGKPVVQPLEHEEEVNAVAWSPDGSLLATASGPNAYVWKASTGAPVSLPLEHRRRVNAIAWSPDGSRLATASYDHTARIWDAVTGLSVIPSLKHQHVIDAVAWSSDGSYLACLCDKTVRVWDPVTGLLITGLPQRLVVQIAWSPEGTRLATASQDRTARVWNAITGLPVAGPLEHESAVNAVAWSPDGTRLATASHDQTARVWDSFTSVPVTPPFPHQNTVLAVAWSPDGTRLATIAKDQTARLWEVTTGGPVSPPFEHQSAVTEAAWSPDGTRLATIARDQTTRVWNAIAGVPITVLLPSQDILAPVAWSPDGARLATVGDDQTARVWEATTGRLGAPPLEHPRAIKLMEWAPDGSRLAIASRDQTVQIWSTVTGQSVTPLLKHQSSIHSMSWSPDGLRLITVSTDGIARMWDATTGQSTALPFEHRNDIVAVAWSPDGTWLATARQDQSVQVWNAATGCPVTRPLEHEDAVRLVAWSPDGMQLATATDDRTVRVWSIATGHSGMPPLRHQSMVHLIAWSPCGSRLATVSDDAIARIWKAFTSRPASPPLEHQGSIRAIAWGPDGTRLATGSDDGTAQVWNAYTGRRITPPLLHQNPPFSIAWSLDGARLATVSLAGPSLEIVAARIWDVSWDASALADWQDTAMRSDYRLNSDGVHVLRTPEARVTYVSGVSARNGSSQGNAGLDDSAI